jgi:hypothetical protein
MSARPPFNQQVNEWLDDGPVSAPREDLAAVLRGFPEIRQRSFIGPWRITMPTIRFAVAAVIAIAVGALALAQILPSVPSVGTQPTPGWQDRFPTQSASAFARPFTYAIDPASGLELKEDAGATNYQFGVAGEPGPAVVVQHPDQGFRLDPCSQAGGGVNPRPTAAEFVAYIKTVPGLKVTELPPWTIDGRPTLGVDVQRQPDQSCPQHYLFAADDDWTCCWPDDPTWTRRIWAMDVNGSLVLVATPYSSTSKEARLELADSFVDTIHFEESGGTPTASS